MKVTVYAMSHLHPGSMEERVLLNSITSLVLFGGTESYIGGCICMHIYLKSDLTAHTGFKHLRMCVSWLCNVATAWDIVV